MSSSAFFAAIVIVIGIVLAVFITPILFIPVALILLLALFSAPLLAWWVHVSGREPRPHGHDASASPSSSDASYDPVDRPEGLTPRG
jgi:hypothetical protein